MTKRVLTERAAAIPALAETFRIHGYEGASLSMLCSATGLGKGSLYNFFPGGKEEMMAAVLADIDQWFDTAIFAPLARSDDAARAIHAMMEDVSAYFHAGGRICLVGWIGLGASREVFGDRVHSYFARWIAALSQCLESGGVPAQQAAGLSEEAVSAIQGAIILSRALDDRGTFTRIVNRHRDAMLEALPNAARQ